MTSGQCLMGSRPAEGRCATAITCEPDASFAWLAVCRCSAELHIDERTACCSLGL